MNLGTCLTDLTAHTHSTALRVFGSGWPLAEAQLVTAVMSACGRNASKFRLINGLFRLDTDQWQCITLEIISNIWSLPITVHVYSPLSCNPPNRVPCLWRMPLDMGSTDCSGSMLTNRTEPGDCSKYLVISHNAFYSFPYTVSLPPVFRACMPQCYDSIGCSGSILTNRIELGDYSKILGITHKTFISQRNPPPLLVENASRFGFNGLFYLGSDQSYQSRDYSKIVVITHSDPIVQLLVVQMIQ